MVQLKADGLATLHSVTAKGHWVLNMLLPGQDCGMVGLCNEKCPYLSMWRSVFDVKAPQTLDRIDTAMPGQLGQGKSLKAPILGSTLALLCDAHTEAAGQARTDSSPLLLVHD